MKSFALLLAVAASAAGVAQAQSADARAPQLGIGAGVIFAPDYSGADTYRTIPVPMISAQKELTPGNLAYIRGLEAGVDHTFNPQTVLGLKARYRFGRDSSDSARLTGMPDVDGAVEMGPRLRYQLTRQVGLEGEVLFDVTDAHQGYVARVGADYALRLAETTVLKLGAGMTYGSGDYMQTYYGVPASQATASRRAYTADAGLAGADLSATLRHGLNRHWSLQATAAGEYLVGEAADSPLVEQKFQPRLLLGAVYTF